MEMTSPINLPADLLLQVKEFLLDTDDQSVEKACIVTKDREMIPMTNMAEHPAALVTQDTTSFVKMIPLVAQGKVDCWIHSHPQWKAIPSVIDIANHRLPIDMVIYSVPDDEFRRYSNETISNFKKDTETTPNKITEIGRKKYYDNIRSKAIKELETIPAEQ